MQHNPWDPEGVDTALGPNGVLADGSQADAIDLRLLYKRLVGARCLDVKLSRLGLPHWVPSAGEEAPLIALGMLAGDQEWVYTGARDAAVALTRGVEVEEIVRQCVGDSNCESRGRLLPGLVSSHASSIAPMTESLGVGVAMACGQAHAHSLRNDGLATAVVFGEGLTTTGPLQESIAIAVQCDLPIVMVCKSRLWPTGAPAEAGCMGDSVAERFTAWGLRSRRCDGADPVGTHHAIRAALERARAGEGPSLVEVIVTPQLAARGTAGADPSPPPPPERDPIERLRRLLDREGDWSQTFQDVVEAEVNGRFDRVISSLESERNPDSAGASKRAGGKR
jgi:TPP-dependent pyruvate/acetoin dehydrogenase alpha subunit